jgi:hypothetical protein
VQPHGFDAAAFARDDVDFVAGGEPRDSRATRSTPPRPEALITRATRTRPWSRTYARRRRARRMMASETAPKLAACEAGEDGIPAQPVGVQ